MNKVAEFYQKAMSDESSKEKIGKILCGKTISDATDEELVEIGKIAEELGFDITLEEAKAYLFPDEEMLSDDELDAFAGGKGDTHITCTTGGYIVCTGGGGAVNPNI